jgi:hypothetical protein
MPEVISLGSLGVNKGGIVPVGGGGQGPDPAYTYEFEVVLNGTLNAYSAIAPTTLTFSSLVGVYPGASAGTGAIVDAPNPPGSKWSYAFSNVIAPTTTNPSLPTSYHSSDLTWTYHGSSTVSGQGLVLGYFEITTQNNLPGGTPQPPLPTTINYNFSLNGGTALSGGSSGVGSVILQPNGIITPEPSTMIAPLCVIAGLPVVWLLRRRQVEARAAA